MGYFFDEAYREEAKLANGQRVRLRLLRPSDARKLVSGFRKLSPESRYRRFFTQFDELPRAVLEHLTAVDGSDHVALAAAKRDAAGRERAIVGVARFIRYAEEPDIAEASVAVIDALQRQGLGGLLCKRLISAAAERGVRRFRTHLLAENRPVLEMIHKAFPDARFQREGPLLIAELELPEAPAHPLRIAGPRVGRVLEFLRLAARGAVSVRTALHRLRH